MKTQIMDFQKLKKFDDVKRHQETIWSDDHSSMKLLCMKPGQEITTHTHHGNHIWIVLEGKGELVSAGQKHPIDTGKIVVVPTFEDHGIRNTAQENLVLASITANGD